MGSRVSLWDTYCNTRRISYVAYRRRIRYSTAKRFFQKVQIVHWSERLPDMQEVVGSIPSLDTTQTNGGNHMRL